MFQHLPMRRAPWRTSCRLAAGLLSLAAHAQQTAGLPGTAPAFAAASDSTRSAPLSIDDAVTFAQRDQPRLRASEAAIAADEQLAASAAQLPDPKLTAGVQDLPVDGDERFSVRDDTFTMFTVGLSQEFPRAEKRRLKAEQKQLDATIGRLGLDDGRLEIARDSALAWLDVYEAEHTLALVQNLARESALQVQALDGGYRSGHASQADWLAAQVEAGLADDRAQDWRHRAERLRAVLARWIGDAALRPLADDLGAIPEPPALPLLNAAVDRHPAVLGFDRRIDAADTEVKLARQAYKPDFSVAANFGYRPAYSDFAGLQVAMDLPLFRANRQDRGLAAALQQADAARDRKADALRELHAQATADHIDWHHDRARAAAFEHDIIPAAARRIDAARNAYAAGSGSFDAVLSARRSLLETQAQALALTVDAARAKVRLRYFTAVAATGAAP